MSEPSNTRSGAATPPEDGSDALPAGTRLAEFEIREVIGIGGFGIVYRAWDEALERDVALKEYMPVSLAGRGAGGGITLRSRTHEETFALGKQSFVNEARLLARFDQAALVKVFRFWEGNGTAYMAMPLYKGLTLRQLRKKMAPATFNDAWMRGLIEPLLGALEVMHEAEVYHRDIAPDNILWCDDNRPVLLDFGAARLVLGDRTQNVTAVLKPQFAPIEQYAETPSMRQGPWTDLYALAGTCYFMLTGRAPLPATTRVMTDELEPLVRLAPQGCSPRLLQLLDWAMAVRPQDRPQSVAQFRDALAGRLPIPLRTGMPAAAGAPDPAAAPAAGYEKTIQVSSPTASSTRKRASTSARPSAPAPASRFRNEHFADTPERSVMLPPQAQSSLKAVLLIVVLLGVAAGAWTTRQQWMPLVGLQVAAAPAAPGASSPEAEAASAPVAVAEPASAAASQAVALAGEPATSAAASAGPASQASQGAPAASEPTASVAEAPSAPAPAEAPDATKTAAATKAQARAARAKAAADAHSKALAARIAALTLPPPTLPPANEAKVVSQSRPLVGASPDAAEPASAGHGLGPREACAGLAPAKMAACIKQLCDNEPRYQAYPVCQRVHRQEEKQTGASE